VGPPSSDRKPLLFVTVGTDHHPFDRLVRWVDAWLEAGGNRMVRALVQHGTSIAATHAESRDFLGYDAMLAATREAAAVACHGGPATIMLAADAGKVPIVVPRRRALGESVDDHQLIFAGPLASEGTVVLAESEQHFRALVEDALAAPVARARVAGSSAAEAVRRFEEIVDELVPQKKDRLASPIG
jgi:UDP-N-acetylglucosamine transferase subunit ALG13